MSRTERIVKGVTVCYYCGSGISGPKDVEGTVVKRYFQETALNKTEALDGY